MTYNVTNVANSTGVLDFVQNVNSQLMYGTFGVLLLVAFGGIIFFTLVAKTGHANKSMATTFFLTFIMGVIFATLNLVHEMVLVVCLFGLAVSLALMKNE